MIDYVKQGKRNRVAGLRFEKKVREDLISKGWIVSKWQNNIKDNKCVSASPGRFRMMQTGFPDFIAYKNQVALDLYEIIFVEVKSNGYLKPIEKEKAKWYLENDYCSNFLIASKGKKRGEIIYKEIE